MIEWRETTPDPWTEAATDPAGRRRALGPSASSASVVLHASCLALIERHGAASPSCEVGGLLLGKVHHDATDTLIEATTAFEAPDTLGSGVHLAFTPQTWDALLARMAREAPELAVVGWYHTHPGLGVFLSGTDQHTHAHHFRQPWQFALVHDPASGDTGCFKGMPAVAVSWTVASGTAGQPAGPSSRARSPHVAARADWRQLTLLAGILGIRWLRSRLNP